MIPRDSEELSLFSLVTALISGNKQTALSLPRTSSLEVIFPGLIIRDLVNNLKTNSGLEEPAVKKVVRSGNGILYL